VRRAARVADCGDHVAGLHRVPHRGEQGRVVIVDRVHEQVLEPAGVADGDRIGALLRRAREDDDPVADGVHRRAVGVIELDTLMLLEVTAHGRAVAVRLVDVRLIGEGDRALEPGVPQAGRPFLSSHAWRAGSSRDSPCSVPTHTTPPESAARARTRPGAGNSIQLRPPSLERATPRSPAAHRLPSGPAANASTYWSGSRPRTCSAVVAPAESVISPQVAPRSQ